MESENETIIENKAPPTSVDYITDGSGEIFNKNFEKILRCPYCMKIPIIYASESNVTINCINNHKNTLSYEDFRPTYFEKWKEILKCCICSKSFLQDSFFYCIDCDKYFCNNDKNEHLKIEKYINHKIKYIRKMESICSEHNDKIYSFCNECNKDICVLCIGHEKHNQTYINSIIINENDLQKYKEEFENIKLYVKKTYENIEKVFIEMRKTFEKIKKRNVYQIDLAEYLLGCYALKFEERDLNYNIISNLSNFFSVFKQNINKNFGELCKIKWPFDENESSKKSLSNLKLIKKLNEHSGSVNSLIVLDNGDFVSSSSDSKIIIYDFKNLSPINIIDETENGVNYIYKIEENKIISCSNVHTMKIFKLYENNTKHLIEQIIYGHKDNIIKIIQNNFDKTLISCSEDKTIKIWNVNNNNYIFQNDLITNENVNSILYIKKNEILSSSSTDFTIKFWNLKTLENISVLSNIKCSPYPNSITILSNEYIGVGGWDNNGIYIINIDKRIIVRQLKIGKNINFMYNLENEFFFTCEYNHDNELQYHYDVSQWKMDNKYNNIKCISSKSYIHHNLITAITKIKNKKEIDSIFLTSSYDKKIKIWK